MRPFEIQVGGAHTHEPSGGEIGASESGAVQTGVAQIGA